VIILLSRITYTIVLPAGGQVGRNVLQNTLNLWKK